MVIVAGRVAEFDSPASLLKNEKGIFYGMVKAADMLWKELSYNLLEVSSVPSPWKSLIALASQQNAPRRRKKQELTLLFSQFFTPLPKSVLVSKLLFIEIFR